MKKVLKIGDTVECYNGTNGKVTYIDKQTYFIRVESVNNYPTDLHIQNIKRINNDLVFDSDEIII